MYDIERRNVPKYLQKFDVDKKDTLRYVLAFECVVKKLDKIGILYCLEGIYILLISEQNKANYLKKD